MIRITLVAGARPNFMKIAPLVRAIEARDGISWRLVHTGQHYDREMNEVFFEDLGIPAPQANLAAGGGSHAEQTARIMVAFEQELLANPADWLVVVGDVNSTLACSIVAKKLSVNVAHVEAGLRSGDRAMPEEINRLVTDAISDLFFVTEPSGRDHLLREGQPADRIHFVGHVMIDNLYHQVERLSGIDPASFGTDALKRRLLAEHQRYGVVTLHRPSNVDDPPTLAGIADALNSLAAELPLVFPVHPRTRKSLASLATPLSRDIHLTGPLPYPEFLNLWKDAAVVLTDSGGVQEETTALGVRCVTLRRNTERPITLTEGTNVLAGVEPQAVLAAARDALTKRHTETRRPELWDGKAALRIVDVLLASAKNESKGKT